jgi:PAS domain S-box-containing protein
MPGYTSISLKVTLLAWLVTVLTLGVFIAAIIPEQHRELEESLRAKATTVAISVQSLIAGAAVNEDYSQVVDHALQVLESDRAVEFIVITRNDGYSLWVDRKAWRSEPLDSAWRPDERKATSSIGEVPLFGRRAFRYSRPLDYSGIPWGWIHVGLTLEGFDRSVARLSSRTALVGVFCVVLAFAVSVGYARRFVRPILGLERAVERVALGELSARAEVHTRDELGQLAAAFNSMAGTIQARNRMLESVNFASRELFSARDWREVIVEVLGHVSQTAGAHRAQVTEFHQSEAGLDVCTCRHEWTAEGVRPTIGDWQSYVMDPGWAARGKLAMKMGEVRCLLRSQMSPLMRAELAEPVQAVVFVPIRVQEECWGVLSMFNCVEERVWNEIELSGLRVVAKMLGAAIERQRTETELAKANETLEQRVAERTGELEEARQLLARNVERLDLALDGADEALWDWYIDESRTIYNERWSRMLGYTPEEVGQAVNAWETLMNPHDLPAVMERLRAHLAGQSASYEAEFRMKAKNGAWQWIRARGKVVSRAADGTALRMVGTHVDITAYKQAEESLLELSRRAGMAEVATGVLHNVGNVLNSVNVSATIVAERVRDLRISNLVAAVEMIQAHGGHLDRFLEEDVKGQRLLPYLGKLAAHLNSERETLVAELRQMTTHVGHIKEIVAMQQNYARTSGVVERLAPATLLEDALRIVQASFERHGVTLRRDYEETEEIATDRHKVLQILLNLLRNAKDAVKSNLRREREVTVRIRRVTDERIVLQVSDNGIGIEPEHLRLIFSHGFTTKPGGHGFGLHSGALAAHQIGGTLSVESPGPERGATFSLELPMLLPTTGRTEEV